MRESDLKVVRRPDGGHEVQTLAGEVLAVCATNEEAWRWVDKHSGAGQDDTDRHYRIRNSDRFS